METYGFRCPVCGFRSLSEPVCSSEAGWSYEICLSCGFEFGFTDEVHFVSYSSHRAAWVTTGMKWSSSRPVPRGWDAALLLRELQRGRQHVNTVPRLGAEDRAVLGTIDLAAEGVREALEGWPSGVELCQLSSLADTLCGVWVQAMMKEDVRHWQLRRALWKVDAAITRA